MSQGAAVAAETPHPPTEVVTTDAGPVRGRWRPGSAAFLGIPFAAPPVGERRFDAPHPHPPWSEVLDARRHGPTPQRRLFSPKTTIPEPSIPGESTLNVNVFTPAPGKVGAGLPVIVWIHGGGYFAGSPASPWYDGASFNRDGVVTVTISYRLGFDGFGWIEDGPANRGMLDQIAALEWVQANIEAFGGDPARVTIAGQSAGASSVLTLLATPRAQPLYGAAVVQSGVARGRSLAEARELGIRFARQVGVEPTRAGWSTVSEERILDGQAELRARPEPGDGSGAGAGAEQWAGDLVRAMTGDHLPFVPMVDGELIPEAPVDAIAAGSGSGKRLLLGSNAHELTIVTEWLREGLREHDPATLLVAAGVERPIAAALADRFPDFDAGRLLGQFLTERLFRMPLLDIVDAHQRVGASDAADARQVVGASDAADARQVVGASDAADLGGTWLYDFRWTGSAGGLVGHCHELPFVWDLLDAPGVADVLGADRPPGLARAMHRAWVAFVRDGDPGWASCSAERRPGMVFDGEHHAEPDPDPYRFEAELRGSRA